MSSIGGLIGPTGRAVYAAGKFGLEGFSESPSKKGRAAWHKGHDRRTGGFRAGSSTALREGRPEYDETVGATGRFQRNYDGKETMSLQRALSITGLMRSNGAVGF